MPAMPDFGSLFGGTPQVTASAPGRVNLIGEHTDYNGGFVLPIAIPQRAVVEAAAREDRRVRVWSAQMPGIVEYELGHEQRSGTWVDYVQGMTQALAAHGVLGGFDARIDSAVPPGSGLSSSAALEIALGRALRTLFGLAVDDVALAVAARRAENELVGAPVGIMDQMAASLADTNAALFIDTRSLAYERVRLPATASLVVIDSGVSHQHAGGEYVMRREECAAAAAALGVPELRDLGPGDLDRVSGLPEPLCRRARHVVLENQRVLDTVEALRAGDLPRAGRLFDESHTSMRDDFAITVDAIDQLVESARAVAGVYGARMTGGGFGGAIVALVDVETASRAGLEIVARHARTGCPAARLLVPPT